MWLRACTLHERGDHDPCRAVLGELLSQNPAMDKAGVLLAQLERERGDWARALELLQPLVAADREPGDADWERMIAATLAGKWDVVRDSARRLGMDIPGEGPIVEAGGLCRIVLNGGSGEPVIRFAERISPVSARIIEISGPDGGEGSGPWRERYGDIIVFEPTPADSEHRDVYTFTALATAEPGGYRSFVLDGVYPGDDLFSALQERLSDHLRGVVQVCSGDSYQLTTEGWDEPLIGIYAHVAVPETATARTVHKLLRDATASWPHPVTWLQLARALDDPDEIRRQMAIAGRYNL
jgi:hypothetical protein